MDEYLGEVRMVAFNFAPVNWVFCKGQQLEISQNVALFSIIGTYFGGDGINNFLLPDMRGRTAIGTGSATGLSTYALGQQAGSHTNVLSVDHLPLHEHTLNGSITMYTTDQAGNNPSPAGNYFASDNTTRFRTMHDSSTMQSATLNLQADLRPGGDVDNMMPFLSINFIICLSGAFPARF